ncbi:MAG: hypothetical protein K9N51_07065 [Candidatus Pacebacteria bacterium]|nr:hypothetical protein [Candidatus Paceibacterota bacterium]
MEKSEIERCTQAAVYYKDGKPYSYSLFMEGQTPAARPIRGIYPDIVSFAEAYAMFSSIRKHYRNDGTPIDE